MNFDERILKLEALTSPGRLSGTQIVRVLNPDAPGLIWCLAVGVMQFRKRFFYGATMLEALEAAELALLAPVVPDTKTLRVLAKAPSTLFYQGEGILAVFDMTGINLADYAPKPRRKAAEAVATA